MSEIGRFNYSEKKKKQLAWRENLGNDLLLSQLDDARKRILPKWRLWLDAGKCPDMHV